MSFYGSGINRIAKNTFYFDRTFKTRYEMDQGISSDQVFIGRFVLVSYDGTEEESARTDLEQYQDTYDSTVWQKTFKEQKLTYIKIADLSFNTPDFTTGEVSFEGEEDSVTVNKKDVNSYSIDFQFGTIGKIQKEEEKRVQKFGQEEDQYPEQQTMQGIYNTLENKYLTGGFTPTIRIGKVTEGQQSNVSNSGTETAIVLDFVLVKGPKGDPGTGIQLKGAFNSESERDEAIPVPEEGYACIIKNNADSNYHLWIYNEGQWKDYGELAITTIDDSSIDSQVNTWSAKKIHDEIEKKTVTINRWGDLYEE